MGGVKLTISLYRGKKFGKEKFAFLQKSDVLVFPTFYNNECFPVVLLEAMQHKLPVITTNEGGVEDIIEDGVNGFVCERQDAPSVADRLIRLITNESLRTSMGEAGYEKYQTRYTLPCFERKMKECLMESM